MSKEQVLASLEQVSSPDGTPLPKTGKLSDVMFGDGKVFFSITVDAEEVKAWEPVRKRAEEAVRAVPGVRSALVALTAERKAGAPARAPAQPAAARPAPRGEATQGVPGVKPIARYGLSVMSIGFLIDEETPMIWRGPMVISALTQMLREVEWGALDVMVVDMPPGTGDAQLTMAQQVPLKGAVIVSTPQDLALIDARRGVAMFRRVNVPVLGVIENMSYFLCPQCGTRSDIFSHGGARHEADRLGVLFLGEVPLHMAIREKSDAGLPVVATEPDGPHAAVYRDIAVKVRDQLQGAAAARPAPRIVIEA